MKRYNKKDWQLTKAFVVGVFLWIGGSMAIFQACNSYDNQSITRKVKTTKPSIAVLPFDDMSSDNNQAYFGEGIAEEILNTLANLEGLKVAGRTSSFSFKGKEATIKEIGNALKVEHVLEGSVRREGDKIRITAQLIKVADGFHLWSHKYDRDFEDVFSIQDEVAQSIGETLLKKLAPEQLPKLHAKLTQNSEAYSLFLRAKHIHLTRYYGNYKLADFKVSESLFLKAIALDSTYALAYAGLADLYDSHKDALADPSALKHYDRLKIDLIEKAWQLNPDLSYVNIVRGWVMRNKKVEPNDLDAAYNNFLRGFQLNPSNTDGLFALAFLHEDKNLFADADELLAKAIEIDPLRATSHTVRADFLMRIGKYDLATKSIQDALTINPRDLYTLSQLAMSYIFNNQHKKALATYQQINQIDTTYLQKSVIDYKLYALVNGDTAKARQIPTSLLDYRGENVIINGLIGEVDSLEISFLKWWEWYQNFKGERSLSQSSAYSEFIKNPIYKPLREKEWFKELVQEEKEKYHAFKKAYPRAATILKEIKHKPKSDNIDIQTTNTALKYAVSFLVLLLCGLLGFLWYRSRLSKNGRIEKEQISITPENVNPFVLQLNEVIDKNLHKSEFGIPQLCKAMGLSRAQLYRKIKKATGTTPALYIRNLRLQKAKIYLKSDELNITEIAYAVGFNDLSYFSRSFSEEFGKSPSEMRK
ncbi:MAG: helix-turn-helix domain-containing protein [Saprospiraceae bacterium]